MPAVQIPAAGRLSWLPAILRSRWALPGILGLGGLVRLSHIIAVQRSPTAAHLQLDHRYYDEWAQRIAAGDWLGDSIFFVDPGYAYFLAIVYWLFGHSLLVVRIIQALLGLATACLAGAIGRRVYGSVALGNAAALLVVLFVPLIHNEGVIEKAALATFLYTLALWLFLRSGDRAALLAGLVGGLAALLRGNLLLLLTAGVAALLLRRSSEAAADLPWWKPSRAAVRRAALLAAGAAMVISVVTVRNLAVGGQFVLTTSNLGANLYIGNHRGNPNGTYRSPSFVRSDPRYEEEDFRGEAQRRLGRDLNANELSRFWTRQALSEVAADPGGALRRAWRKARLLSHQFEVPDNENIAVAGEFSPVLRLPAFWMGQLFPFCVLGAIVAWRRSWQVRVLTVSLLLYAAALIAFFVLGRFRALMVPATVVLAVGGIRWLAESLAPSAPRRRRIRGSWAAIGVALGLVVCLVRPGWMETARASSAAIAVYNYGSQLSRAGDTEGAIAAWERAVSTSPESVIVALRTLGDAYLERGEWARAERHMKDVLRFKPDSARGKQALVRLYEAMGRESQYRDDPEVRRKLEEAYRAVGRRAEAPTAGAERGDADRARRLRQRSRELRRDGRYEEAIVALQKAIEVGPYDEGLRYELGNLMEKHAGPGAMVDYWSSARSEDPKPQTSLYFWAVGLLRQGDESAGLAKLAEALEVDPAHEMSEERWGAVLEKQGRLEEALEHFERATEIHPDFRKAHESCARVLDKLGRAEEAAARRQRAEEADPASPRRYLHWGRYLVRVGRFRAAIPELEKAVRALPRNAEARELLELARSELVPGEGSRAELVRILRGEPEGTPVWFAVSERDTASQTALLELEEAFLQAGWKVEGSNVVPFSIRPGVLVLAADATPPRYVQTALAALRAAGMEPRLGTNYRRYFNEMKRTRPGFQGFELDSRQAYIIVLGRMS